MSTWYKTSQSEQLAQVQPSSETKGMQPTETPEVPEVAQQQEKIESYKAQMKLSLVPILIQTVTPKLTQFIAEISANLGSQVEGMDEELAGKAALAALNAWAQAADIGNPGAANQFLEQSPYMDSILVELAKRTAG